MKLDLITKNICKEMIDKEIDKEFNNFNIKIIKMEKRLDRIEEGIKILNMRLLK